jgi:ribosome assembly protein SQT1
MDVEEAKVETPIPEEDKVQELPPDYVSGSDSEEEDEFAHGPLFELQVHSDSVCSVAIHPTNPEIMASGGVDDKAYLKVG